MHLAAAVETLEACEASAKAAADIAAFITTTHSHFLSWARLLCDSATGILGGELHLLGLRLLDFLSRHFESVYIPKDV